MKLIYHENPDEAVRQKCLELDRIRKAHGEKEYFRLMRDVVKKDPWFLMRVVLEYAWLDEKLVGHHFIKHIADNWGEDLGVLFPRGHGKTLPMSAMCISGIINNPNISIVQISRTEDNADKIGAFISDHLLGNDYLQQCFGRKFDEKDGFLPSTISECRQWGKDGYTLPYRRIKRIDPTLLCLPLKGAKAGKHPDIIWLDDPTEKENNNELGWAHVEDVIRGLKYLLPSDGFFFWTGTRWHDADPLGKAANKKLRGKQGQFSFVEFSCYEDDNPLKPPTYPRKIRWNMDKESGYTHESLEEIRNDPEEGQMFDAQMRNNPSPADRSDIKKGDINIYSPDQRPPIGPVRALGMEVEGGGLPIFNGFRDYCEELKISVPLVEMTNPKKKGTTKADRIIAALQPIVSSGRMFAQHWMIGDERSKDTLGYELQRIRVASHDDIADALHNVPAHLAQKTIPVGPIEPAHLYISVDLAWSEEKRADFTVCIAVAVDHNGNYWILDYDRFQISSPTEIYLRILKFYRRFEEPQSIRSMSQRKHPGSWR